MSGTQDKLRDIRAFLDKASTDPAQCQVLLSEALDILSDIDAPRPSQIPPDKQQIEKVCRGIGHDFNGILANIRGMVEVTQMMVPDAPEQVSNTFDKILAMVERGHHASEMIRLYGKVHDCQPSVFQLTPMLKRCLNDIRIQLNLPFQLRAPSPSGLKIKMDMMQLEVLLLQLVKNARDALTEVNENTLKMTLSINADGLLLLEVQDKGKGIARAIGDDVYQPFYSTQKVGKGLGLGLSIARHIVMNHDGFINYSSAPLEGTTFRCTLPVIVQ